MRNKTFLETKFTFYASLVIILLVVLSVWISGISSHQTLFQNSIISTTILAVSFFLFISFSLYNGVKLKDNLGSIFSKEKFKEINQSSSGFDTANLDIPEVGFDGIGGIILGIIAWIFFTIILLLVLYIVGVFFWSILFLLLAMLYWIYFRALRLIFKNSGKCKGNLLKSISLGFLYSAIYVSWIYGIIYLIKYIN